MRRSFLLAPKKYPKRTSARSTPIHLEPPCFCAQGGALPLKGTYQSVNEIRTPIPQFTRDGCLSSDKNSFDALTIESHRRKYPHCSNPDDVRLSAMDGLVSLGPQFRRGDRSLVRLIRKAEQERAASTPLKRLGAHFLGDDDLIRQD
jgi:hypothetical protein